LKMDRDPAKLRADVLEMRATMAQHKPAKGPLDVKLARGGLVDAEFIVHYLQLRDHVALEPSIPVALAGLIAAGKLDPAIRTAHRTLARFLIASRLLAPDGTEPDPGARAVLASACECDDWRCLIEKLTESRRTVADAWAATFGETLEIA
ncbi:MAG: glutamine-synthetase adenylyltransferase, partial [Novosphingobium sp.]